MAYLLLAAAVLCWAGNWVMARGLRFEIPPSAMTFWRWAVALAVLVPFTFDYLRRNAQLIARSWKILCLLGLLATALQHIPIYIGLHHTSAINGVLLYATAPIFIVFLAALVGETVSLKNVLGTAVALIGMLVVISRGEPAFLLTLTFNPGDLRILIGTLAWTGYTVCLRWWPAGISPLGALSVIAAVGVASTAPFYAFEIARGEVLEPNAGSLLALAYMGVFASVLAYIFWNTAVDKVGAARAGPFMYLMLVFTPLLSVPFLDEQLNGYHLLGGGLICGGIMLGSYAGQHPSTSS
jgi:drug/metabolite transporter (DMT)-like permease